MKYGIGKIIPILFMMGLIIFLINILIDNPYFHSLAKLIINEKITQKTNLELKFQALGIKAFPPGVDLYGLKVTEKGKSNIPLLEAAHIKTSISVWSLFMGNPKISVIESNELKISYPFPKPVESYFVTENNPSSEQKRPELPVYWPPSFDLPVNRIILINSTIDFNIPNKDVNKPAYFTANLKGLNIDFKFRGWNNLYAELDIQSLDLITSGSHIIKKATLATKIRQNENLFQTEYFTLNSYNLNFSGSNNVNLLTSEANTTLPHFSKKILEFIKIRSQIKLDSNSDLEVLGTYLDIKDTKGQVKGEATVTVSVPISRKNKNVQWKVSGAGESLGAKLANFLLYDSNITFDINQEGMDFKTIKVKKGDKEYAKGYGRINFDNAVQYEFYASPKNLPLSTLLKALVRPDFELFEADLASANLKIWGKGFPFILKVTADSEMENITVPSLKIPIKRFNKSPSCNIKLNLTATENDLRFDGTRGQCISSIRMPAASSQTSPAPPKTRKDEPSEVFVDGPIFFDSKKGISLKITAKSVDATIGSFYTQVLSSGSLSGNVLIQGPYSDIRLDSDFMSDNLKIENIPLGKIDGKFGWIISKDEIFLTGYTAIHPNGGRIHIPNAVITMHSPPELEIETRLTSVHEQYIASIFLSIFPKAGLQFGVDDFYAKIKGPLLKPFAYNGKVNFNFTNGFIQDELLFTKLTGSLQADKNGVSAKDVKYSLDNLKAMIDFNMQHNSDYNPKSKHSYNKILEELGLDMKGHLKMHLKTIEDKQTAVEKIRGDRKHQDHLSMLPYAGKYLSEINLEGKLSIDMFLEGTLEKLQGKFDIDLDDPVIFGSPLAPFQIGGFINGSKIDIPLISHSGNALVGRLSFDLDKPKIPYEWYFSLNRFDLRAIGSKNFYNDPRNYLYVTASWNMAGHFEDFWKSKGNITLINTEAKLFSDLKEVPTKIEFRQKEAITIVIDPSSGWNIKDNKSLNIYGEDIEIFVGMNQNIPPDNLNIGLSGSINLDILKKLLPYIENSKGRLAFTGTVSKKIEDPDIFLKIRDMDKDTSSEKDYDGVTVGFSDIPPPFKDIHVDATYRNGILELNRITATKGKLGKLLITGNVDFSENAATQSLVNINLDRVDIERVPFAILKNIDSTLSGDLSLAVKSTPMKLSGNLIIDKALSAGKFDIRKEVLNKIYKTEVSTKSIPKNPLLELSIHVQANESVSIQNRNLAVILSSDVNITGNENSPVIIGNINIPKGKFTYKRDFEIQRGSIVFDEPSYPPDPKLDIIGETKVSTYKVSVYITGNASSPKVSLSIDPPNRPDGTTITKMDILVLLSSGQLPDSEKTIGEKRQATDAAKVEAANLLIGQFEEPIEKLFDLSGQTVIRQVYLDTYQPSTEVGGSVVPRLNLPVDISDDFKFIFQVDNNSNMRISSEYSIHDGISLSGSFDKKSEVRDNSTSTTRNTLPETDTGVDLRFRFTYP
ncbi:MAG: translocation/assembly module TamB domain-containing protein [Oligoflexales bacterium]|nr:translocation/assembly module TamB domain-containing protein [Oligoflexales bacterium]